MTEEGIDSAHVKPQFLSTELAQTVTLLVTMGCGDACPYVPGITKLDWPLVDPKGQRIEIVRKIRDDPRARCHSRIGAKLALTPTSLFRRHMELGQDKRFDSVLAGQPEAEQPALTF